MKGSRLFTILTVGLLAISLVSGTVPEAVRGAIPEGTTGEPGFLDIPGAPHVNLVVAFLWAVWVGWVFSTVGAFGGIMAGVGHLTVFGLGDYATGIKEASPALNALITDSIRVSNQWIVGLAALISTFNYYRMKRLVYPLGLSLGAGALLGSMVVPILTAGKISLKSYLGYFGLFTLLVGFVLLYETTPGGRARKRKASDAAKAFETSIKGKGAGTEDGGVRLLETGLRRIRFTFYGQEFEFDPVLPFIGGLIIGSVASLLGVGGGFLYVPYLTSMVGLPFFIVAGTSALAVLVGMTTSIFSFMAIGGVPVYWSLIGVELVGVALGSYIGPKTSKYIPERYLKVLFVLLAFYVGIRYVTKGFLGYSLVPPY